MENLSGSVLCGQSDNVSLYFQANCTQSPQRTTIENKRASTSKEPLQDVQPGSGGAVAEPQRQHPPTLGAAGSGRLRRQCPDGQLHGDAVPAARRGCTNRCGCPITQFSEPTDIQQLKLIRVD